MATFIIQNLEKCFKPIKSYEDVKISTQNSPFSPSKTFSWKNMINMIFMCLLAPFNLQNFEKSSEQIQILRMRYNFGSKMAYLPQPSIFWKNSWFKFHVPFVSFYCAELKKFLEGIQSCEVTLFLNPKWSICPKWYFFFQKNH